MLVLALTGPSGSGKTTLQKSLLEEYPDIYHRILISTNRKPRVSPLGEILEQEGSEYYFREETDFDSDSYMFHLSQGGNTYGISRDEWQKTSQRGQIGIIACGYHFIQAFSGLGISRLLIAFLDVGREECKKRMLQRGSSDVEVESRTLLFNQESESKTLAHMYIGTQYVLNDVHNQVTELLKIPSLPDIL